MIAGAGMYTVNKYSNIRQGNPQMDPNPKSRNSQQYVDNGAPQQQNYFPSSNEKGQQYQVQ